MMTDPIADMLTRIRNGLLVEHSSVKMPSSKIKAAIAKILMDEGFVEDYHVTDERPQPQLVIKLKYTGKRKERRPVITELERISRPGRRIYTPVSEILWVRSGMGIAILSTNQGLMTDREARQRHVGGEVLCQVW